MAFAEGYLELADDEAWLLSDASPETTAAQGFGDPIDSRVYGPVPVELLVGRAWFRYAPLRRIGRIRAGAPRPEPRDPQPRVIPAARQSSANAACASSVGDQRVGKQTRRSSPTAANPASVSTRS